jgi:hypothetical protein
MAASNFRLAISSVFLSALYEKLKIPSDPARAQGYN